MRWRSRVLVPLCTSIIKCTNKIGLKEAYGSDEDVQNVVQCLVSLPLLPPEEIVAAIDDVEALTRYTTIRTVCTDDEED